MLKALARWPARRIALLWAALLLFAAILVLANARQRERLQSEFEQRYGVRLDAETHPQDRAAQDSIDAALFAALRAANAHDASSVGGATHPSHDSSGAPDTSQPALQLRTSLSPAQRDSLRTMTDSIANALAGPVIEGLGGAMSAAMPVLIIALLVVYGVPLGLIALTVAWFIARGRYADTSHAAA